MGEILESLWSRLGLGPVHECAGVDWALPAIEALASRSTSIVLKLDGERDDRPWTIVVSGGVMGDDFYRTDERSAEAAIVAGLTAVALQATWSD